MPIGIYYSPRDWYNPDYGVGSNSVYEAFMQGQIRELLTNYGKINLMWWDSYGKGDAYYDEVEKYALLMGDYDTPEQTNKYTGTRLWESCMTMNNNWAFLASDHAWKSTKTLIALLIQCAVNNGNFLLNVGPTSEGIIPQPAVDTLAKIGLWTSKYGESFYDTRGGPIRPSYWGGTTCKGNTIYVHLLVWSGTITLPALPQKVLSSRSLNGGIPTVTQTAGAITLSLPSANLDPIDNIIAIPMKRPLTGAFSNSRLPEPMLNF